MSGTVNATDAATAADGVPVDSSDDSELVSAFQSEMLQAGVSLMQSLISDAFSSFQDDDSTDSDD